MYKGKISDFFRNIFSYCLDGKFKKAYHLEEGKIDLMMSIARSEAREKVFDFTNNTVISNWG